MVEGTIKPASAKAFSKRYVLTFFPAEDYAKLLALSLKELQDIFYQGCFQDRHKPQGRLEKVKVMFDGAKEVRIVSTGTI